MAIKLTQIAKGTLGQRQTSTDEVTYGQGDDGQNLNHCSVYVHGFGKVANPQTRGGREKAREGTDLEDLQSYRERQSIALDARYHQSEVHQPDGEVSPDFWGGNGKREVQPFELNWWEQDETEKVDVRVEARNR